MAEAWTRNIHAGRFEAYSAGTNPGSLDPHAVRVMSEAGVDMSRQRSKGLEDLAGIPMDLVVTVCAAANETCPVFPGTARRIHAAFDDPPRLAAGAIGEEAALVPYRRVRDEIRAYVAKLPELVAAAATGEEEP